MRYRIAWTALAAYAFLSAACATPPLPGSEFPAFREAGYMREGYALLVVYRDARRFASYNLMPITCDGETVIRLPGAASLQYFVQPGRRTIGAGMDPPVKGSVRRASLDVVFQPGRRYFLKIVPSMGLVTINIAVENVPEASALEELKTLKSVVGPQGELAMVENPRPATARGGEEAVGEVFRKIRANLQAGAKLSVIVVVPGKDVNYDGPPIEISGKRISMEEWRARTASSLVTTATGELLASFGGYPGFSVVNRENVRDILQEFELQGSGAFDRASTSRMGLMVGANYMVLLSFSREHISGGRYRERSTVKLVDMERNTVLALDTRESDYIVDMSTMTATTLESRLNGRRYTTDPATRRTYFIE